MVNHFVVHAEPTHDRHLAEFGDHASVTWFAPQYVRCSLVYVWSLYKDIENNIEYSRSITCSSRRTHGDRARLLLNLSVCITHILVVKPTFTHPARDCSSCKANVSKDIVQSARLAVFVRKSIVIDCYVQRVSRHCENQTVVKFK